MLFSYLHTEHCLLSPPSLYKEQDHLIISCWQWVPATEKSCKFLSPWFFVWWYIGVTAWTGLSLQRRPSLTTKPWLYFSKIFWPAFLFCGMFLFSTLTTFLLLLGFRFTWVTFFNQFLMMFYYDGLRMMLPKVPATQLNLLGNPIWYLFYCLPSIHLF